VSQPFGNVDAMARGVGARPWVPRVGAGTKRGPVARPNITAEYLALAGRIDELADEYPSRDAFAHAVGMSRGVVYAWIDCKRHPQANSLIRICILLNVHPNWLLLGIGPKRPPEGQRISKMLVDCHAA
jgi:hypothetical protein